MIKYDKLLCMFGIIVIHYSGWICTVATQITDVLFLLVFPGNF